MFKQLSYKDAKEGVDEKTFTLLIKAERKIQSLSTMNDMICSHSKLFQNKKSMLKFHIQSASNNKIRQNIKCFINLVYLSKKGTKLMKV